MTKLATMPRRRVGAPLLALAAVALLAACSPSRTPVAPDGGIGGTGLGPEVPAGTCPENTLCDGRRT